MALVAESVQGEEAALLRRDRRVLLDGFHDVAVHVGDERLGGEAEYSEADVRRLVLAHVFHQREELGAGAIGSRLRHGHAGLTREGRLDVEEELLMRDAADPLDVNAGCLEGVGLGLLDVALLLVDVVLQHLIRFGSVVHPLNRSRDQVDELARVHAVFDGEVQQGFGHCAGGGRV